MPLPIAPPVAPMLARLARDLPGGDWLYAPALQVTVATRDPAVARRCLDAPPGAACAAPARWRPDRDAGACTLDQLRGFG